MAARFVVCLAALSMAQVPVGNARGGSDKSDAPEPRLSTPAIETKWTEPAIEIFLEHTATYWSTGPLLKQVREFMVQHSQTGPMFVRYLTQPFWTRSGRVQAQVGFVADRPLDVQPPLKSVRRDAEFVACTVIEDRAVKPRTDYGPILAWSNEQGHRPRGPIVEVYGSAHAKRWTTEIRVVLESPPRPSSQAGRAVTPQAMPQAETARAPEATGQLPQVPEPEKPDTPVVSAERIVPVNPTPAPDTTAAPAPPEQQRPMLPPACEPEQTLAGFIAADRFDCVALALMPAQPPIPVEHQAWIGQVVFRVKAAAKGIKPGAATTPLAISDALMRRYRGVAASFALDPFNQVDVITHPASDLFAKEKRATLQSLDVLMVRISIASIEDAAAAAELITILGNAENIVRRSTSEQDTKIDDASQNQP